MEGRPRMAREEHKPELAAQTSAELQTVLATDGSILPAPLRHYQWQGVRFLFGSDAALLCDEMGLGKTVQTAVALQLLMRADSSARALIVCPGSLCLNWQHEMSRWCPRIPVRRIQGDSEDRRAHYLLPFRAWIASYEQVRQDVEFLSRRPPFGVVILDEAQRIKNPSSDTATACKRLRRRRSWALTGTPLENRAEELAAVFAFVRPGLLFPGLSRRELHSRMAKHFLRRRKGEVLAELPPILAQDLPLELTEEQQASYIAERARGRGLLRKRRGDLRGADLLAQITRLKLICNFDPASGGSSKMTALETIVEELLERRGKLILFSQYVRSLRRVASHLVARLPAAVFHGGLSAEERAAAVAAFENEPGPRALLVSLRAGGVGLNLPSADMVVLFDRWWNPAVEAQAIHRAHRLGRKTALHVVRFMVVDTVEERIQEVLNEKQALFDAYVETAQDADIPSLSREDLLRILGVGSKLRDARQPERGREERQE